MFYPETTAEGQNAQGPNQTNESVFPKQEETFLPLWQWRPSKLAVLQHLEVTVYTLKNSVRCGSLPQVRSSDNTFPILPNLLPIFSSQKWFSKIGSKQI